MLNLKENMFLCSVELVELWGLGYYRVGLILWAIK